MLSARSKELFNSIIKQFASSRARYPAVNKRYLSYSSNKIDLEDSLFSNLLQGASSSLAGWITELTQLQNTTFASSQSSNVLFILKRSCDVNDPELLMALAYIRILGSNYNYHLLIIGDKTVSDAVSKLCFAFGINHISCVANSAHQLVDFCDGSLTYQYTFCLSDVSSKIHLASLSVLSGLFGSCILNMSTILTTGSPHLRVITSLSKYSLDILNEYTETSFYFPTGGASFVSLHPPRPPVQSGIPALISYTSLHKYSEAFVDYLLCLLQYTNLPLHLYPYAPHYGSQSRSDHLERLQAHPSVTIMPSSSFKQNIISFNYILGLSAFSYPNVTSLRDLFYFSIPTLCWSTDFKRLNMGCLLNQLAGFDSFNLSISLSSSPDPSLSLLDNPPTPDIFSTSLRSNSLVFQ